MSVEFFANLNLVLSDARIISDVKNLLKDSDFELGEGDRIVVDEEERFVPANPDVVVVGKIAYLWNFDATCGQSYYRVKTALGMMRETGHGWVEAQFGFIVLMYDEHAQFMKADWFEQFEFDD